jgi:hypothetical protein
VLVGDERDRGERLILHPQANDNSPRKFQSWHHWPHFTSTTREDPPGDVAQLVHASKQGGRATLLVVYTNRSFVTSSMTGGQSSQLAAFVDDVDGAPVSERGNDHREQVNEIRLVTLASHR